MVETWFIAIPFLVILFFISWVDVREGRIPDQLVFLTVILGIIALFFGQPLLPALGGGAIYFLLLFVIHSLFPEGMGWGDVKLAGALGLVLGWQKVLLAFLLSFIGGAVIGLALIALGLKGKRDPIPFAPFMAGGAVISFFWGERIINWYLNLVRAGF